MNLQHRTGGEEQRLEKNQPTHDLAVNYTKSSGMHQVLLKIASPFA